MVGAVELIDLGTRFDAEVRYVAARRHFHAAFYFCVALHCRLGRQHAFKAEIHFGHHLYAGGVDGVGHAGACFPFGAGERGCECAVHAAKLVGILDYELGVAAEGLRHHQEGEVAAHYLLPRRGIGRAVFFEGLVESHREIFRRRHVFPAARAYLVGALGAYARKFHLRHLSGKHSLAGLNGDCRKGVLEYQSNSAALCGIAVGVGRQQVDLLLHIGSGLESHRWYACGALGAMAERTGGNISVIRARARSLSSRDPRSAMPPARTGRSSPF